MKNSEKILAERISRLRKTAGYSISYVARKIRVTVPTYIQYERGRRRVPFEKIRDLAHLYLVTADYLIGMSDEPQSPELRNTLLEVLRARVEEPGFFDDALLEELRREEECRRG